MEVGCGFFIVSWDSGLLHTILLLNNRLGSSEVMPTVRDGRPHRAN